MGELIRMASPDSVRAFRLPAAAAARSYELIVQSASEVPGQSFDGRVRIRAERASSGDALDGAAVQPGRAYPGEIPGAESRPSAALAGRAGPIAGLPDQMDRDLQRWASWFEREHLLRQRVYEEVARTGASAIRPARGDGTRGYAAQPPRLGDTIAYTVGVATDLIARCDNPTVVRGEVKYAGRHFTVVEDLQLGMQPEDQRFSASDFAEIGRQLDDIIYPVSIAYFGENADIDDNESVIALITPAVNALTPADDNTNTLVAGFFLALDLIPKRTCPASNEGEIFYLAGPDPDREFGTEVSLEFADNLVRTTVAHEFVHLLNTQQRVTIGGGDIQRDREHAWLDEGLAHLAEEISGFRTAGIGTRSNLDLAAVTQSDADLVTYNRFHLLNHNRVGRFLRGGCPRGSDGPAATLALGDDRGRDPGGVESLAFRGFSYAFARWLGDHFGESGSGALPGSREEGLFLELSSGGPTHAAGTANIERAVRTVAGADMQWEELLSLFLASVLDNSAGTGATDERAQWKSWNLAALYGQLSDSNLGDRCPFNEAYPLSPTNVTLHVATNSVVEFTIKSSTGRYLSLASSGATPATLVEITDRSGSGLPSSARTQLTLLRTR